MNELTSIDIASGIRAIAVGSSLDKDTLNKLHPRLSTTATLAAGLETNGDISRDRLVRESLSSDFCVSEITFLNVMVLFTLRLQGWHSKLGKPSTSGSFSP